MGGKRELGEVGKVGEVSKTGVVQGRGQGISFELR